MKEDISKVKEEKALGCPDEATLSAYLNGTLSTAQARLLEEHAANCSLCLENIRTGYLGEKLFNENKLSQSSNDLIRKAKGIAKMNANKKRFKSNLWLLGTVLAFAMSFTVPKYFVQFLVAALILGLKWVSESEGIRTLIVSMEAKRRHSQETDEEATKRFKERF